MKPLRIAAQHLLLLPCVLILLLGGCTNSPTPQHTPLPSAQATTTPYSLPTPVTGLLDPIPADCQPAFPPETRTYTDFGGGFIGTMTLHGGGQVWLPDNITVLHLNERGPQPLPGAKVLWVTGPNPTQTITVQGQDQLSGTPIWFQIDQSLPATTLELDPGESNRGGTTTHDGNNWEIWGTLLIFVKAGCYHLEASWPGGQWSMTIAAGR